MQSLPGPRIEPVSPALAGRFLSTAPLPPHWQELWRVCEYFLNALFCIYIKCCRVVISINMGRRKWFLTTSFEGFPRCLPQWLWNPSSLGSGPQGGTWVAGLWGWRWLCWGREQPKEEGGLGALSPVHVRAMARSVSRAAWLLTATPCCPHPGFWRVTGLAHITDSVRVVNPGLLTLRKAF